jgi:hypothetical protein
MRRGMFLTPIFIVGVMVLSEGFADEPFGHLKYMLAHVGEDGVGLGSDFDGAKMPSGLGNAAGLQNLVGAMRTRGFDHANREDMLKSPPRTGTDFDKLSAPAATAGADAWVAPPATRPTTPAEEPSTPFTIRNNPSHLHRAHVRS